MDCLPETLVLWKNTTTTTSINAGHMVHPAQSLACSLQPAPSGLGLKGTRAVASPHFRREGQALGMRWLGQERPQGFPPFSLESTAIRYAPPTP